MEIFSPLIIAGLILFILTILSGFWLGKLGRPLNVILFNIHKISALTAIVLMILGFVRLLKSGTIATQLQIVFIISGISLLLTLVTGGLLSFDKFDKKFFALVHRFSSFLVLVLTATGLYFLAVL